jgi:uncharacterized protein YegP (UPF0339 family)
MPGKPKFEVYKDKAKEWRWRLVSTNGRTIADSGEGYKNKGDVETATEGFTAAARDAEIVYL